MYHHILGRALGGAVFVFGLTMFAAAQNPVPFVREELPPMPGCPNEQTDRFAPPDVRPEALFDTSDIDFTAIEDWTADFVGGEGQFYLSSKQAIRGVPNARIEMRADTDAARIILRPAAPVSIDHSFDTVEAWVYGSYHEGTGLTVHFRDSSGRESLIQGGNDTWSKGGMLFSNWMLYRQRVPEMLMLAGSSVTAIEFGPLKKGNYLFTLDALRLTKFDLSREDPPQFPNAGAEIQLPVTPEGSCPVTRSEIATRVYEQDAAYILEYTPADASPAVRYVIQPETGTMDDLSVEIVDRGRFRPAAGSGPELIHHGRIVDPVADASVPRKCVAKAIDDNCVSLSWEYGDETARTRINYRYHLMGKTLAVDVESDSPTVTRWRFGHADGLETPRIIETPYRRQDSNVLFDRGFFTAYLADWYAANVSTLPNNGGKRVEGDQAWYAYSDTEDAYAYLPRTDGSRWPLKERFYVAVSSHYDEVLPTVNNPPSPLKDVLKKNIYLLTQDPGAKFPLVKQYVQQCIDLGMTNTYFIWHAGLWSNRGGRGPEPFIGRSRVSETFDTHGGTQAVVDFLAELKKHGLRVGYYEGYAFMQPTSGDFRRDWLAYLFDGNWQPAWVQSIHPKNKAFAEYCATVSKARREIFGADVVYMDGWTSWLPHGFNDYDHRYPDSGKMITSIQDIGRAFRNLRQTFDGPAFTEGSGRHYQMAGLVDGSYAQVYDLERKKPTPLFVDFELLKTHELGGDLGMGSCSYMFTPKARPDTQDYYDFVASEIAFGHVGLQEPYAYFYLEPEIFRASLLTYFMVQQLQEQYVMEPVEQIRYFDGEKLIDTDEAIARDVQLQSRVYIKYRNGLQIWANCNPDGQSWTVEADGTSHELPKGGWLAKGKDLLEFSAMIDGRRVDYSDGPNYLYVNPGNADWTIGQSTFAAGVVSIQHKKGPLAGKLLHWPAPAVN